METRKIGSLDASVVGLGTNNFGGRLDAQQTAGVVNAALDAGVTFIDTADVYGETKSEQFIGEALKSRRDEAVLATKFGSRLTMITPVVLRPLTFAAPPRTVFGDCRQIGSTC